MTPRRRAATGGAASGRSPRTARQCRTQDLLNLAIEAARKAGGHAMKNRSRRSQALKRFRHDVKLELDVECQRVAESRIRARFPDHAILGEEDPGESQAPGDSSTPQWVIDPIDGTVNFSHGLPFWCCSVAVRAGAEVLAGAVYAPELDLLYTASVDAPAKRNGRPIRVSDTPTLDLAIVMTGLDKNVRPGVPPLGIFSEISAGVQKARILGCAALDLCLVAAGAADAYFEAGIYIWDVAAAGLIVRRAGGRAEQLAVMPDRRLCYLASNGRVHKPLRERLMPLVAPLTEG